MWCTHKVPASMYPQYDVLATLLEMKLPVAEDEWVSELPQDLYLKLRLPQHYLPYLLKGAGVKREKPSYLRISKDQKVWQYHTAVIGGREKCNQMSLSKTFKAIHYTFMCTYNQLKIIVITEFHDPVRLKKCTLLDGIKDKWFPLALIITNLLSFAPRCILT